MKATYAPTIRRQIHRNFFETVSDHLAEDGVIVLQENNRGSTVQTFRSMIEQSGFAIFFSHGDHPTLTKESSFTLLASGGWDAHAPLISKYCWQGNVAHAPSRGFGHPQGTPDSLERSCLCVDYCVDIVACFPDSFFQHGALGNCVPSPSDAKSPRPVSRRGLYSCDDEHMQVICPTWQVFN
jgi:hypothetical protein